MNPLCAPLGSGEVRFWRIDSEERYLTWDSGEGANLVGGRWNSKGTKVVYTAVDPATAILEVAVHKGFVALNSKAHYLSSARIPDLGLIHVVYPADVPNPNWLAPVGHHTDQQKFGDDLISKHPFVMLPSTVSKNSWNLLVNPDTAAGHYDDVRQERFGLDPRLSGK